MLFAAASPTTGQIVGVLCVAAGVALASLPADATSNALAADPLYIAIAMISFAFPALAGIIKESIFKDAVKRLGGQQLEVLVVNAYCSAAQVGLLQGADSWQTGRRGCANELVMSPIWHVCVHCSGQLQLPVPAVGGDVAATYA